MISTRKIFNQVNRANQRQLRVIELSATDSVRTSFIWLFKVLWGVTSIQLLAILSTSLLSAQAQRRIWSCKLRYITKHAMTERFYPTIPQRALYF